MEVIYYKCEKCGYVHQVPSYWSGHAPEERVQMPHLNMKTKEMCDELTLKLIKD